jgi:cellulose synthase/poly-beta-1,6-N-acetylglucosamine synthase-like glycosyltransferase
MHDAFMQWIEYFNQVTLLYFAGINLVYTVLMCLALYAVTFHSKLSAGTTSLEPASLGVRPPVALIVPAFNEENGIVQTVLSLMRLNYPEKEIIVVDDGSTDHTVQRLVEHFQLTPMELIYRESLPAKPPCAFYASPRYPGLVVLSKANGGKADALNAGLNMARSPYFCTVDADTIIDPDGLLRLMAPIVESRVHTVVSAGIVRVANGSVIKDGRVVQPRLPESWLERCQVVEYIRTFLFGRPAWNLLHSTFICSGAFCLMHRETVVQAGGFSIDTVTEDTEMITKLHRHMRDKGWKYRMVFTPVPVCWTEVPHTVSMLAKQRRRWQLGLLQTVGKHDRMIANPRYHHLGLFTVPFHAFLEGIGALIETIGTILVPISFALGIIPLNMFLLFLTLAVGYGTMLSVASILLHERTQHRYSRLRDVFVLILFAFIENLGYRQMVALFRAQGVLQYFLGHREWERVVHIGQGQPARAA